MANNKGRSGGKKGNPQSAAAQREEAAKRRSAAREKARQIAEAQARKEHRTKVAVRSAIGAIIAVVLVVVGVMIWRAAQPGLQPSVAVNGGVTLAQGDAVVASPLADDASVPAGLSKPDAEQVQEGAPHVEVIIDLQCPVCQSFELANGELLKTMVNDGAITLEYNPISILDSTSGGNNYSTRGANAALCVADSQPETFLDALQAMFVDQPEEGAGGRTDEELFGTLEGAGVDLDQQISTVEEDSEPVTVRECISEETFSKAVSENTQAQADRGFSSTPTVLINGTPTSDWQDPNTFAAQIIAASEGAAADAAEEAATEEGAVEDGASEDGAGDEATEESSE